MGKQHTFGCRPWLKKVACLSSLVLPWCVHVVCILIQNFWLFQIITNFVYYVVIEVRLEVRLAPFPHEYHCNAPNDIGNNIFLYTTQVNNAQWLASTAENSHYFTIHSWMVEEKLTLSIQVVSLRMVLICFLFSWCGIYYIIYLRFCESGVYIYLPPIFMVFIILN